MQIAENINVLPYLITVIGFLMVYVLNGIKGEIRDTKTAVQKLEVDLRGAITELRNTATEIDKRVTVMEVRCPHTQGE